MNIRPATIADVPATVAVINEYAERGLMIHRSRAEFFDRLRDLLVAIEGGEVVGVVGLRVMWANLAEVYALAVRGDQRGKGLGRQLVEAAVNEARCLGVRRLFSLTYERAFFERCGFAVVDRRTLPMKVWGECIRCPKHEACDEIAMTRVLDDVPDHDQGQPTGPAGAEYDVPVPRVTPATLRVDRAAADHTPPDV